MSGTTALGIVALLCVATGSMLVACNEDPPAVYEDGKVVDVANIGWSTGEAELALAKDFSSNLRAESASLSSRGHFRPLGDAARGPDDVLIIAPGGVEIVDDKLRISIAVAGTRSLRAWGLDLHYDPGILEFDNCWMENGSDACASGIIPWDWTLSGWNLLEDGRLRAGGFYSEIDRWEDLDEDGDLDPVFARAPIANEIKTLVRFEFTIREDRVSDTVGFSFGGLHDDLVPASSRTHVVAL